MAQPGKLQKRQPLPPRVAEHFVALLECAVRERNADKIRHIGDEIERWVPPAMDAVSEMSLAEFAAAAGWSDSYLAMIVGHTSSRTVQDLIDVALTCPEALRGVKIISAVARSFDVVRHLADRRDVVGRGLLRAAADRLRAYAAEPGCEQRLTAYWYRQRQCRRKHEAALARRVVLVDGGAA